MTNYKEKIIDDAFNFMRMIGGADRLSEAGWKTSSIMTSEYMEEMTELVNEYINENVCILKTEECLEYERELYSFFKNELLELMR